ncbi:MAG: phospho-N-acetylmuramoyl-pentapeptide-transferase [Ruminococcaceae bacterium]|nr:phospho-N-acetylmuramoyl-pentapeptide-transferase [Oscillospiraceae bacterium]
MYLLLAAVLSFVVCVIAGPLLIPVLHKLKFGQEIREIGPSWHKKKSGTPTMGGLIFIAGAIIATLVFARNTKGLMLLLLALAFGIIGFVDDFIKVILKRNLGLTDKQKFLFQLFVSILFLLIARKCNWLDESIMIPFMEKPLDLKWIYYPFAVFVLIGGTNAVNLTDGLDGLASSVTVVVGVVFTIAALAVRDITTATFAAIITGGCLGFLIFNAHPAKVFMGDTGSLFLGGAVCGIALVLEQPLALILIGGVYVLETLSVIIQVTSFKLTKKRVFKMSPIHHHFEMCGWSERRIVICAVLLSVVLGVIGLLSII